MNGIKLIFGSVLMFCLCSSSAQVVTADPAFPTVDGSVKITFDASQGSGGLSGFVGDVYAHTGVITNLSTSNSDWKYVIAPWTSNITKAKLTSLGGNKFELNITPSIREFYGVPEGEEILKMAFVFRSADGSKEGKDTGGADIFVQVYSGDFAISLTSPTSGSVFVNQNDQIAITASAFTLADFVVTVDGQEVVEAAASAVTSYSYNLTATYSSGSHEVKLIATDANDNTDEASFFYTIRTATVLESRPAGIIKGINYNELDNTKATLCLIAPNKSSVYVVGDFNEWNILEDYQMKKDGEHFWLEVNGLTPGQEYAFQYLVDEAIYIADPHADKILDKNDSYIPSSIYPNLKAFPEKVNRAIPFYNTVSVLQTDQVPFEWVNTDFQKPEKSSLLIYELLIRDFFGNGDESYQNLIDTLSYIKSLGVNAIELMPVTEFSGNDSWGYNPNFMFAVDKAYGTKNDLKTFIDTAHGMGIAVILDMVMNQQDFPAPYALMYMDMNQGNPWASKPSASNPWFNVNATHDFSVFFDMNHLSSYTQDFVDSVNHYWINEYHFDGYRFDLSKGFMQTGSFYDYNQERVNILTRMANAIWSHSPDAYVILEHLGANNEETVLSNNGMMLWGIMHNSYKEIILGFESSSSNISSVLHTNRGWSQPHLVGYMESHDEERQIYEAQLYANTSGYNARTLGNSLERMAAASAFLFTIPGPKMIWQFGELGYDLPINRCEDGSVSNDCRTHAKPSPWDSSEGYDYYGNSLRDLLRQKMSAIMSLKTTYNVFSTGTATITNSNSLQKQISIRNVANNMSPATSDEMNVLIVGNFGVTEASFNATFLHSGTWYDYFSGETLELAGTTKTLTLSPGSFHIYTDVQLEQPNIVLGAENSLQTQFKTFPNPTTGRFEVAIEGKEPLYFTIYNINGGIVRKGKFQDRNNIIEISNASTGLYLIEVITRNGERMLGKIMKQ